ncbi:MAG: DNA polymerase III subunit gamma/tau [Methylophilaceae bacterium]|nr:DNA polymerase III subunit gamma/tau [Methylophilaceae bacterium]
MSYQVLARKWRPKSFDTLVGQEHVVRALTNALEQQRLHHAYLFTGTRGVGKTTIARIMAKSLNCETGITATPCGVCSACIEIDRGRFVDMLEVDAASNTQVDAMRDLLDNAQYAPTVGRFKVYIIDEVHMLSKSAFNAMLKTLEEPPAHVKFILATTDPQKVPVTVLSRCLQFNLRQMAGTTITEHLKNILGQENISFEIPALHLISRAAQGSMRDALSLTDQAIAYGNNNVNEAEVRAMLGAIDQSYLFEILNALVEQNGGALLAKAKQMEQRSISFEAALSDLAALLQQIAVAQTIPSSIEADSPERLSLLNLAEKISAETLQLYYQIALLGRRDISLAPDEYAGFTMSLLRMLAFTPNASNNSKTNNLAANAIPKQSISPIANEIAPKVAQTISEAIIEVPINKPEVIVTHTIVEAAKNETPNPLVSKIVNTSTYAFDGDWFNLVKQLNLGLARTLAQNSELISYDGMHFQLTVSETQKHLLSASNQEKLSAAINQHFGKKVTLQFSIGCSGNTLAQQNATTKAELQSNAETSILEDSFVQALINDFGAQIVPSSIKPVQ